MLNKNVIIIPNAIPFGEWQFTENKKPSDKVRIFWAGGISHKNDLKILDKNIYRLTKLSDKVEMVIGGYCDDYASKETWDKMVGYFTHDYKIPHTILTNTSPLKFMCLYENADVMLIPLENNTWNGYKSNLKILEAATKKIPCIVSNVAPYSKDKDCPVLWVNTPDDWMKHLKFLINNPNAIFFFIIQSNLSKKVIKI